MGRSAESNPETLQQGEQQLQDGPGTQTQVGAPEQPVGQPGSEPFTDVDITQINRDDLTPEMQVVYDGMLEMYSNMNTDYTQKTQAMASIREDAELWQSVQQHPVIRQRLGEMLLKVQAGESLDSPAPQSQPQPQTDEDPNSPQAIIRSVVRQELQGILPSLQGGSDQVQQVLGYMQQNQAALEFSALCQKYPAAQAVGVSRLNMFRSQYSDTNGNPISMEQAFGMMALNNPALLAQAQTQKPAPKSPAVEQPASAVGATATMVQVPAGAKALQAKLQEMADKKIPLGLDAAIDRALNKLGIKR